MSVSTWAGMLGRNGETGGRTGAGAGCEQLGGCSTVEGVVPLGAGVGLVDGVTGHKACWSEIPELSLTSPTDILATECWTGGVVGGADCQLRRGTIGTSSLPVIVVGLRQKRSCWDVLVDWVAMAWETGKERELAV